MEMHSMVSVNYDRIDTLAESTRNYTKWLRGSAVRRIRLSARRARRSFSKRVKRRYLAPEPFCLGSRALPSWLGIRPPKSRSKAPFSFSQHFQLLHFSFIEADGPNSRPITLDTGPSMPHTPQGGATSGRLKMRITVRATQSDTIFVSGLQICRNGVGCGGW